MVYKENLFGVSRWGHYLMLGVCGTWIVPRGSLAFVVSRGIRMAQGSIAALPHFVATGGMYCKVAEGIFREVVFVGMLQT